MKKLVFVLAALCVALIGCDKKDKGGGAVNPYGYGYGPYANNPYTNPYGNGAYGRYQFQGNVCYDTQTRQPVANTQLCANSVNQGYLNNGYYHNGFGMSFNSGVCSTLQAQLQAQGRQVVLYPMYYPGTNQTLCVEYSYYQHVGSYGMGYQQSYFTGGTPYMNGGFNMGFNMGCIMAPTGLVCY